MPYLLYCYFAMFGFMTNHLIDRFVTEIYGYGFFLAIAIYLLIVAAIIEGLYRKYKKDRTEID